MSLRLKEKVSSIFCLSATFVFFFLNSSTRASLSSSSESSLWFSGWSGTWLISPHFALFSKRLALQDFPEECFTTVELIQVLQEVPLYGTFLEIFTSSSIPACVTRNKDKTRVRLQRVKNKTIHKQCSKVLHCVRCKALYFYKCICGSNKQMYIDRASWCRQKHTTYTRFQQRLNWKPNIHTGVIANRTQVNETRHKCNKSGNLLEENQK